MHRAALYDSIGGNYTDYRRPDPRLAEAISSALGDCNPVVNVGAGTGSYEPSDRETVAVEPSRVMIDQRAGSLGPCLQARAEALPFRDKIFDGAIAILTLHHWSDVELGLAEVRRVTRGPVVILTWFGFVTPFWLIDYFPEIETHDSSNFPGEAQLEAALGPIDTRIVPIPHDCSDGFLCAYWRRPEAYLDSAVRSAISTFSKIPNVERGLRRLESDLSSGVWQDRHAELMRRDSIDYGYRLVVAVGDARKRESA